MRALLTHAWLFLGKWLGRLLLLLLAVGLGGWAIGSLYYAWKFSGPVSAEEQIAPDEARITQAIIQDAIRVVEQHRDNTRVLRDAHAKAHGCVKAEFKVRADLDPTLRRGVFAEAGKSWNAWVRFSNGNAYPQFDSKNDARGMAIKLLDVPGENSCPAAAMTASRTSSCSTSRCSSSATSPNTGRTSPPRPTARKPWPSSPTGTPPAGNCATC